MTEQNRWWLVIAAGLAVFMVALDASIVTVALPTIGRHFGVPAAVTEWTILGYLLPMVALVLPIGRWLDQNGRRTAFALAVGGFALASVAAGAAPGMGWLIAARVVQGGFGAMLMALVPAMVSTAVRAEVQGRAMSLLATLGPLGAVSGPAVGGLLVSTVGWSWIFYVNVPVSLAVIAVGLRTIDADGGLRAPAARWALEAALLGGGAAALLGGLSLAPSHGMGWLLLTLAAIPLVALWTRLPTSRPVVDLVRGTRIKGPLLALLASIAACSGAQFIAPYYLQQVVHAGTAVTGLTVLAFPLAMALTGPVGGELADRWGRRRTAFVGTLIISAGLLLLVPLGAGWQPLDLAWRLAVVGVGTGFFAGPNQAVVMQQSPRQLLATTGAATSLSRNLAFGLGPALTTIPWALAGYDAAGMRVAMGLVAGISLLGVLATAAGSLRRRGAAVAVRDEVQLEEAA